jgi:hypothetical protein
MAMTAEAKTVTDNKTNSAKDDIELEMPYRAAVRLTGTADMLFHRWTPEAVDEKAKAKKNSAAKKTDNVETYVYRDDSGMLCVPGEYVRQSIITAAKFRQDPRSPRKSAMDLFKAGVVSLTPLASLGKDVWDYEDKRRVVVQRSGINRVRPAFRVGWTCEFEFLILTPEYISAGDFHDALSTAGRLIGISDFRPTYGRFAVSNFEIMKA